MTIDMAIVSNMSPQELLLYCRDLSSSPSMIILFLVTHLIFVSVGSAMSRKKMLFFYIWGISFVLSLAVLIALIFMPNLVQTIASLFR
jgi:hypothetical protein